MKQNLLLIKKALTHRMSLLFVLLILFCTSLQAQDITVSGTVISSEDNSAIPGVNVLIKDSSTGTTTDLDGNFTLAVPGSETFLVFSSVGFNTQEIQVGNRSVIDITMTLDVTRDWIYD